MTYEIDRPDAPPIGRDDDARQDRANAKRFQLIARIRFQLAGGLLLAVFLPSAVHVAFAGLDASAFQSIVNSTLATFVAMTFGYVVLRHLSSFPGVRAIVYILPTFTTTYLVAFMLLVFLLPDYSRYQIGVSCLLAINWFFMVHLFSMRHIRPAYGLVPGGDDHGIWHLPHIDWHVLAEPKLTGQHFDALIADFRQDMPPAWERFIAEVSLKGIPVYHVKQVAESLTGKVEIEHLSENSLGSVLPPLVYARLKRLFDLCGVAVAAPFVALVTLVTVILIKRDSPGPAFFCQQRMGYQGRPFTIYKLRTMTCGGKDGEKFTANDDPRITKLGQFLRRYRIDELPQIINIARGDMSWIGPRPEALELSRWYETEIPYYVYRHIVRPGITGWAQVHQGNVAKVEAATYKLHYDFFYIKHFSAWLDILIVIKTIKTILTGFGAR